MCTTCVPGAARGQKRGLTPPTSGVPDACMLPCGACETEHSSSARAAELLNIGAQTHVGLHMRRARTLLTEPPWSLNILSFRSSLQKHPEQLYSSLQGAFLTAP